MRALPWPAQAYVWAAVAAAVSVIALGAQLDLRWVMVGLLAACFLVFESTSTLVASRSVHVSVNLSVALAAAVLVGPFGAAVVGSAGTLAYYRDGLSLVKRAFNGAQFVLAAFFAGCAYGFFGGAAQGHLAADDFPFVLLPYMIAVVTYLAVNALLLSGVLWLAEDVPPPHVWNRAVGPTAMACVGYGLCGLIMAALWASIGLLSALLVLMPLVVARWAFAQHAAEKEAYDATIAALCQAVETKDYYTRGHCERVARVSVLVARELGMREDRINNLHYAGMLHDIGKLGVPTEVLQKTGSLTDEEFSAIRLHPTRGADIVREIEFLDEAQAGIVHHHERVDGRGYPAGLAGAEIPEFARVIGVADAFDSMTSTRSYRSARTPEAAVEEIRRHSGTQFDPVMVEALIQAVGRYGWQPHEPAAPAEEEEEVAAGWPDHDDPSTPLPMTGSSRQT